jgi:hypothetical protein
MTIASSHFAELSQRYRRLIVDYPEPRECRQQRGEDGTVAEPREPDTVGCVPGVAPKIPNKAAGSASPSLRVMMPVERWILSGLSMTPAVSM